MNIDDLYTVEAHGEGAEMQVNDQAGKPLDMYITLIGVDSKKWRGLVSRLKKKALGGISESDEAGMIADATLCWRGFMSDGKELEFSRKQALELYKNAPYILEQADRFIAKRANFTKS